jgi:tetratricopeptide (TPR) repeat protein
MAGQALPDSLEPPDTNPGSDPVPPEGAFRYQPFASPSKTTRKPGWRWLRLGLAGFLVVAFFFMWVRWHIPGKNQGQSLEAFQARNFKEKTVSVGAEQETALRGSGSPAAELLPLEQQALSLMASEPQKAGELWRQVIERAPDNIRAHFNLGLVLLRREDYPQAIRAFERVLALDEGMTDARFNLGFAYAKMGRYDEATLQYGQVVDQAPAYLDEVLFNLAIVQDFQGDRQAAARSLHGALRYNPHNVRAISYLARMEGRFSLPP